MALFNKQKQEKKKKGENVIGKIIYGFLLFAPLINILVTCMYVTFNKNAYESYSGTEEIQNVEIEYKYQSNEVETKEDLVTGNIYQFDYDFTQASVTSTTLLFECKQIWFDFVETNNYPNQTIVIGDGVTVFRINLIYSSSIIRFGIYYANNTNQYYMLQKASYISNVKFIYYPYNTETVGNNYLQYIKYTDYNEIENVTITQTQKQELDNAFIYGTQKTEDSNLFNWAKTTGTYTVLNNVTTSIGITNTFIPMLMAYWLLISVVYFLFDIALILVWLVHDKIHDLKDAI